MKTLLLSAGLFIALLGLGAFFGFIWCACLRCPRCGKYHTSPSDDTDCNGGPRE